VHTKIHGTCEMQRDAEGGYSELSQQVGQDGQGGFAGSGGFAASEPDSGFRDMPCGYIGP